jgi:hypothetical protein
LCFSLNSLFFFMFTPPGTLIGSLARMLILKTDNTYEKTN